MQLILLLEKRICLKGDNFTIFIISLDDSLKTSIKLFKTIQRMYHVPLSIIYPCVHILNNHEFVEVWKPKGKNMEPIWRRGGHNYLGNVLYRSFYMDFFNIHIWIIEQLKWNGVEVRWWWYSTKTNISCFQHSHWRSSTIKLCWARCIRLRIEKKSTLFKDLTFGAALIDFNLDQHKIALVIYNEGLHY